MWILSEAFFKSSTLSIQSGIEVATDPWRLKLFILKNKNFNIKKKRRKVSLKIKQDTLDSNPTWKRWTMTVMYCTHTDRNKVNKMPGGFCVFGKWLLLYIKLKDSDLILYNIYMFFNSINWKKKQHKISSLTNRIRFNVNSKKKKKLVLFIYNKYNCSNVDYGSLCRTWGHRTCDLR